MENLKLNPETSTTDKQIFLNSINNFGNFLKSIDHDSIAYTKFTEDLFIDHQKHLDNFKSQISNILNSNNPTITWYDTKSNNLDSLLNILHEIKKPFDYNQILNEHYSPKKIINKLNDLTNMDQLYQINTLSKVKREVNFNNDIKNENNFSFELEQETKQKKFDINEEINEENKNSMNTLGTIVEQPSREENNITNSDNTNNNNVNTNSNEFINNLINNNKIYSNENLLNSNSNNNIYAQTISINSFNKNKQITPKKDYENLFKNSNNKNINSNLNINKIEKSPCFAPNENNLNSNVYINSFQNTNTPMKNEQELKKSNNGFQYSFGEAINSGYKQSNIKNNGINSENLDKNVGYQFTTFKKEGNINNSNMYLNNFENKLNSDSKIYTDVIVLNTTANKQKNEVNFIKKSDFNDINDFPKQNNINFNNDMLNNNVNVNFDYLNSKQKQNNINSTNINPLITNMSNAINEFMSVNANNNNISNKNSNNKNNFINNNNNIKKKSEEERINKYVQDVVLTSQKKQIFYPQNNLQIVSNNITNSPYENDFEEYEMSDFSKEEEEESDEDENDSKPKKFIPKWAKDKNYINQQLKKNNKETNNKIFGNRIVERLNLNMIFETNNPMYYVRHSTADWKRDDSNSKKNLDNVSEHDNKIFPNRELKFV